MANLHAVSVRIVKKQERTRLGELHELETLEKKYKHPLSEDDKDTRPYLSPVQHSRFEMLKVRHRYIPLRQEGKTDEQARKRVWPDMPLDQQPKFEVDNLLEAKSELIYENTNGKSQA